jgi:hypothetical protein
VVATFTSTGAGTSGGLTPPLINADALPPQISVMTLKASEHRKGRAGQFSYGAGQMAAADDEDGDGDKDNNDAAS